MRPAKEKNTAYYIQHKISDSWIWYERESLELSCDLPAPPEGCHLLSVFLSCCTFSQDGSRGSWELGFVSNFGLDEQEAVRELRVWRPLSSAADGNRPLNGWTAGVSALPVLPVSTPLLAWLERLRINAVPLKAVCSLGNISKSTLDFDGS